ncbi:MAG: tetraacyldisaccharide 4'-kinase [Bacteroidales bacterium]|jgi:tetraacyldisaccharide 4'-kinase|nr:tetraacyldisaccharide 4'-kinase [Bacteroidales bacterium]
MKTLQRLQRLQKLLFPAASVYWGVTFIRNKSFDWGILKQRTFDLPIISVGNITVGGTGKTPHVIFIAQKLSALFEIATLSRGYGRKSRGFVCANEKTPVQEIGDEPFLIHSRLPRVTVAVCEKRVEGVGKLRALKPDIQAIILDDAFQHRHILPGMHIVLVDYNRPLWHDAVFPAGFLREGRYALRRATIVIVSKCPPELGREEQEVWRKKLRISDTQSLYFTSIRYASIYHAQSGEMVDNCEFFANNTIVMVSGVAQPQIIEQYLHEQSAQFVHCAFGDHHHYSAEDFAVIRRHCTQNSVILTTEKDVQKLLEITHGEVPLYVLPIEPHFLNHAEQDFEEQIVQFCRK